MSTIQCSMAMWEVHGGKIRACFLEEVNHESSFQNEKELAGKGKSGPRVGVGGGEMDRRCCMRKGPACKAQMFVFHLERAGSHWAIWCCRLTGWDLIFRMFAGNRVEDELWRADNGSSQIWWNAIAGTHMMRPEPLQWGNGRKGNDRRGQMWVTEDDWELAWLMGYWEEGEERIWDKSRVSGLSSWGRVTFRKSNRCGGTGFSGDMIPSLFLSQLLFLCEEHYGFLV